MTTVLRCQTCAVLCSCKFLWNLKATTTGQLISSRKPEAKEVRSQRWWTQRLQQCVYRVMRINNVKQWADRQKQMRNIECVGERRAASREPFKRDEWLSRVRVRAGHIWVSTDNENTRIILYKLIRCYKAKSLNLTKQIQITALLSLRKNLINRDKFKKTMLFAKLETAGCYTLPVRYVYRLNETE